MGLGPYFAPLKWPFRAMIILLGHALLAAVLITAIWGLERYTKWLYGEMLPDLYGRMPLSYLFDTMDAGVLVLFIAWGLWEAFRELKKEVH